MRKDVRIYIYCAATSSILDDSKLLYSVDLSDYNSDDDNIFLKDNSDKFSC